MPGAVAHAPIRTRYLRTNSYYDPNTLGSAPPHFTVYDPAHKRFYVSNPYLNEIDVFDAVQETEVATISIPSPWGIDISPVAGSNTLYAATFLGDIYKINTQTNQIVQRYPSFTIGPNGYVATEVFVLADGRLALLGAQRGLLGVDGADNAAVWNPVTNALDTGTSNSPMSGPSICPEIVHIGAFAVSGDRTRVLMASIDSDGAICSYDPATQQATMGIEAGTFVREIIPTPDGSRFFLTTNLNGVAVFDAKTLQLLGDITQSAGADSSLPNAASGAVISMDGKTLYLVDQGSGVVAAYDTTSFALTGSAPGFNINDEQSGVVIAAIDETGLIAGPMGHGVGFVDASQLIPALPTIVQLNPPATATGPTSGGTVIDSDANNTFGNPSALQQIYIGRVPATNSSFGFVPAKRAFQAQATSPATTIPGPADITALFQDGGIGIAPEGFSYGPTILEVTPNGATAEGGQLGAIIGYGFGSSLSDVQVTVGGQSAQVVALHTQAPVEPYPFPVEGLQFVVPPGTAETAADVTVKTASGTTTAPAAFHYVAAARSYAGSTTLQSGFYDSMRNLYYFADQKQIDIFSPASDTWLAPIPLPGVVAKSQLLDISESPDGSYLAVSDFGGQQIFVLDPDTPNSAKSYPMPLDYFNTSLLAPTGLAITDNGIVYFATADIGGTGTPAFHKLDTSSGVITDLGSRSEDIVSGGGNDEFARVLLSPDGSRVYLSTDGIALWLDTSTDDIHLSEGASGPSGETPALEISGDGGTVEMNYYFTDPSLNVEMAPGYVDWETWLLSSAVGQRLNQDGSILFQALANGIDLFPRDTGRLLYRVQVPFATANAYNSLFGTANSNVLGVITSNGIAFVDLNSLPIPASDTLPFPSAAEGHEIRLSGTPLVNSTKRCSTRCSPGTEMRARPGWVGTNHPHWSVSP